MSKFTVKLLIMYSRIMKNPNHSFFLFGPRSTGKTTWLKANFKDAQWHDLLKTDVYLSLRKNPALLRQKVKALPPGSWVIIDEVQRIPDLLSEVHSIMGDSDNAYHFALSGSSARKLHRLDIDLLAGRVFERHFFPLTAKELGNSLQIERILQYGTLPKVYSEPQHAIDILESYTHTYLQQEIQQEALVKDIGAFDRFLEVAAIMNGEIINASSISREAAVARPTVQRFFTILVDTLIGIQLPAWNPRLKVKEVSRPKFYFFDPGVVRALSGLLYDPVEKAERGKLFETVILHELRAYIDYARIGGKLHYWRTQSGKEVDFIWTRGKKNIGIEVKSATSWRSLWGKALKEMSNLGGIQKAYVVYLGRETLVDGPIHVLPFKEFIRQLNIGSLIG
jgi:predicted AAA+ superfamily ATPase